jgi:hypothetical protein
MKKLILPMILFFVAFGFINIFQASCDSKNESSGVDKRTWGEVAYRRSEGKRIVKIEDLSGQELHIFFEDGSMLCIRSNKGLSDRCIKLTKT